MNELSQVLITRWQKIATDLDLEVSVNFKVKLEDTEVSVPVLVHGFGGKKGTMILLPGKEKYAIGNLATEHGYGICLASKNTNESFNPYAMKRVLSEWGWTGRGEKKPKWC